MTLMDKVMTGLLVVLSIGWVVLVFMMGRLQGWKDKER